MPEINESDKKEWSETYSDLYSDLDNRLKGLDRNLKKSFSSVRRDILKTKEDYSKHINSVEKEVCTLSFLIEKGFKELKKNQMLLEKKIEFVDKKKISEPEIRKAVEKTGQRILSIQRQFESISRSLEELRAKKVDLYEFEEEFNYVENGIIKLQRSIEEILKLKKRLAEIRELKSRIDSLEQSAVRDDELNHRTARVYQRLRALETEFEDLTLNLKSHENNIFSISNRMISRDTFEMECDKFEVKIKRNLRELSKLKKNMEFIEETLKGEYVSNQTFAEELKRLRLTILNIQKRFDDFISREEFTRANDSLKSRYHDLKTIIGEKLGKKVVERPLKEFITPKKPAFLSRITKGLRDFVSEVEEEEEIEGKGIEEKEVRGVEKVEGKRIEKKPKAGLLARMGKAISDFFTVEEEKIEEEEFEIEEEKKREKSEGLKKKKERKKEGKKPSKLPYFAIILLALFVLGLLFATNYEGISEFMGMKFGINRTQIRREANVSVLNETPSAKIPPTKIPLTISQVEFQRRNDRCILEYECREIDKAGGDYWYGCYYEIVDQKCHCYKGSSERCNREVLAALREKYNGVFARAFEFVSAQISQLISWLKSQIFTPLSTLVRMVFTKTRDIFYSTTCYIKNFLVLAISGIQSDVLIPISHLVSYLISCLKYAAHYLKHFIKTYLYYIIVAIALLFLIVYFSHKKRRKKFFKATGVVKKFFSRIGLFLLNFFTEEVEEDDRKRRKRERKKGKQGKRG